MAAWSLVVGQIYMLDGMARTGPVPAIFESL